MKLLLLAIAAIAVTVESRPSVQKRQFDHLPSYEQLARHVKKVEHMRVADVMKLMQNSAAVRNNLQRAADDLTSHPAISNLAARLFAKSEVKKAVNRLAIEAKEKNLEVRDLANLQRHASPALDKQVRLAINAIAVDKASSKYAHHLKQAYEAPTVDDSLKHLKMLLKQLDADADAMRAHRH